MNEFAKAKTIRAGLIVASATLGLAAVVAVSYPSSDPILVRLESSVVSLTAGVLWLLPAFDRMRLSRCFSALFCGNVLSLFLLGDLSRMTHRAQWDLIFHEVARLSRAGELDLVKLGTFMSQTLRYGSMSVFGCVGIWILNLIALAYVVHVEREKEDKLTVTNEGDA